MEMKRTKKITRTPLSKPHLFHPTKLSLGQLNNFFLPKFASDSKLQRKCRNCEDEQTLHRKEHLSQPADTSSEMPSYIGSLSSTGSPLPKEEKLFFEPKFGYDFSKVKIHNDANAWKSAQSANALAYTIGNDIVFNQNKFSPDSKEGKKLLAHELVHVMQQRPANIISPKKTYFKDEGITDAKTVDGVTAVKKIIVTTLSDSGSVLYPYIKDKLGNLPAILDKMRITSAAEFGHSYKALNHIVDTHPDEDIVNTIQGFTNARTKEIFLYLRSNYCHAFHEAIHTLSYPTAFESHFGLDTTEGLTQYFTDIIFTEQTGGVCTTHKYQQQLNCATNLIKDFTFEVAAQIFFQGKFNLLQDLAKKLNYKNFSLMEAHYKSGCSISP